MKILLVSLNDKTIASAGIPGERTVLSAAVTWVSRPPGDPNGEGGLYFNVGGAGGADGNHFKWDTPIVNVGDEIKIKILESTPQEVSQNFTQEQRPKRDT